MRFHRVTVEPLQKLQTKLQLRAGQPGKFSPTHHSLGIVLQTREISNQVESWNHFPLVRFRGTTGNAAGINHKPRPPLKGAPAQLIRVYGCVHESGLRESGAGFTVVSNPKPGPVFTVLATANAGRTFCRTVPFGPAPRSGACPHRRLLSRLYS